MLCGLAAGGHAQLLPSYLSCHGAQCLGDAKSVRALKVVGVSVGKDVEVAARDGVLGRMCEKLDGFS